MCFLEVLLLAAALALVYVVLEWGVGKVMPDFPSKVFPILQVIIVVIVLIALLDCLGVFGGDGRHPLGLFSHRS